MKLLILLLVAKIAFAQGGLGVQGNWTGILESGAGELRMALKIGKSSDGALSGTLYSLDQDPTDLRVPVIRQTGMNVEFEAPQIGASYRGTLNSDGAELVGTWQQSATAMPLTFRRVDRVSVLVRPQEPKRPYPYDEEAVSYENKAGGARLAGTLTLPQNGGPFPVVLLVTGSGQQDRDETVVGHKPFLVLADHLTRNGIAVLRVDDRGVGGSTGPVRTATSRDFAGDVLAGVQFLKRRGGRIDAKQIGLIGHSEGGMIASMVAAQSSDVAFLVLMAGTGVPGDQAGYAQEEAIAKASGVAPAVIARKRALQEQTNAIIKRENDPGAREARLMELKDRLGISDDAFSKTFQLARLLWFRYLLTYDPATSLRKISVPVLALNGDLDLQVLARQNLPAIERALMLAGNRDYTVESLPKLNHLFQTAQTGSPTEYATIEETIAPVVLDTIASWILKHTTR